MKFISLLNGNCSIDEWFHKNTEGIWGKDKLSRERSCQVIPLLISNETRRTWQNSFSFSEQTWDNNQGRLGDKRTMIFVSQIWNLKGSLMCRLNKQVLFFSFYIRETVFDHQSHFYKNFRGNFTKKSNLDKVMTNDYAFTAKFRSNWLKYYYYVLYWQLSIMDRSVSGFCKLTTHTILLILFSPLLIHLLGFVFSFLDTAGHTVLANKIL